MARFILLEIVENMSYFVVITKRDLVSFQDICMHDSGQVNTLRPRQHGRHFADDIFKRICLKENV